MVALLPLYIRLSSVDLGRVSKSNALFCAIPILVVLFSDKIRGFNPLLKFFLIVAMLHVIIFQFEPASIGGVYQSIGICLGSLFLIKYHESYDEKESNTLLNFLCLGALIQSTLAIFQYFHIDIYENILTALNPSYHAVGAYADKEAVNQPGMDAYGSLGNPNLLGTYLALCLPAFFRGKLIWISVLVVSAIILTGSLMAIASAIGAIIYYLFARSKIKEALLYISCAIGYYVTLCVLPGISSGRDEIFKWFLNDITVKQFLIGLSPSWLASLNVHIVSAGIVKEEHNEFLSAFNIFGIFSVVAIAYLFYLVISNQNKNKIFASILFAAFINMHGNFPLHIAATSLIILTAMAHCLKGSYVSNMDR